MAAETYELVISGTLAGQFVQTIFHVTTDDGMASGPFLIAKAILAAVGDDDGLIEAWCDCLPVSYSVTSARCRRILPTGGPTDILLSDLMTVATGQRSGNISSAQVNPVVIWITTPRPNKPGRTFLPGVSETDIDAMVYASGLINAIGDLISFVTTGFTAGSSPTQVDFVIFRRSIPNADDITAGRLSPVVGTQRRRLHPV